MGGLSLQDNSNNNGNIHCNSISNGINNNDINDDDEEEVKDHSILFDNAISSSMIIPMTIPIMPTPASDQLLRITSNTTKNYFSDCGRMRSAATATTTATSRSQSLYDYFRSENDSDLDSDCDSEEEEAKKWRVHTEQQQQQLSNSKANDYQEEDYEEVEETLDDIYNDLLRRRREYHPSDSENEEDEKDELHQSDDFVSNDIDIDIDIDMDIDIDIDIDKNNDSNNNNNNNRKGKEVVETNNDLLLLDNMIRNMMPPTDLKIDLVTDALATMRSTTTEATQLSTNPNQPSDHEIDFIADTLDRMRTTVIVRATCA